MRYLILAAVAVALSGCATQTLDNLTKNQACTTRVSGKLAFGSVTPTGTLSVSAVCKPGDVSPPAATVPEPKDPSL